MRVVLLLAAGAAWESDALRLLNGRRDLVVLKRCVDVDDLLASAASGQADTAVVTLEAPGLDLAAVDHLRRHGVRVVAVAPGGALWEPARVRATQIGVRTVVAQDDVAALPGALVADEPEPTAYVDEDAGIGDDRADPTDLGPRGRTVAVWGPAGAPGRTTLAMALAASVARTQRTTLIDADPWGGSVAQALGVLDEVSGLLSAARLAGSGMLEERSASVQRALDPLLAVVTGLPRPDRWLEVRPGTLELLVGRLARRGHVVVDTGFCLEQDGVSGRPGRNELTLAALAVADEVVVVGTADPVGLTRLARALVEVRELFPVARLRVVVNRMRPTLGWSEREVTRMLTGFAVPVGLHFLPDDRAAVDRALVTGRTLLEAAPDSGLAAAVAQVAAAVVPGVGPQPARRPRQAAKSR